DFLHPDDIGTFYEARMRRQTGTTSAYEVCLIAKDGRQVPILMTGTTRRHKGEVIGYIDTITDLTERKRMEDVLRSARDQAIEASRLKSAFLANMSHEIRTPLNGVIGMAELLADSGLNEEQQEFLEIINTSGNALLSIINEILDFSKISEGKIELEHQPFNLRETIESALDMLASSATQKRLELAYIMNHDIPNIVLGDAIRLRQVLINLLSNAVKFTAAGEVVLTVVHTQDIDGRKQLQFSVRDTGIGIPQKAQSKLFRAFNQVDSSTTRKYGGLLGLIFHLK
ncbi:MAG: PAS domain S-box protein, partial [Sphaerospermopsis sp. SIO1G2]|nr:PAS domain S-box protein [Sphaerospermopsis sp. SIO1G2]